MSFFSQIFLLLHIFFSSGTPMCHTSAFLLLSFLSFVIIIFYLFILSFLFRINSSITPSRLLISSLAVSILLLTLVFFISTLPFFTLTEDEKLKLYTISFCLCNSACLLQSLDHIGHVVPERGTCNKRNWSLSHSPLSCSLQLPGPCKPA